MFKAVGMYFLGDFIEQIFYIAPVWTAASVKVRCIFRTLSNIYNLNSWQLCKIFKNTLFYRTPLIASEAGDYFHKQVLSRMFVMILNQRTILRNYNVIIT